MLESEGIPDLYNGNGRQIRAAEISADRYLLESAVWTSLNAEHTLYTVLVIDDRSLETFLTYGSFGAPLDQRAWMILGTSL